MDKGDEWTGLIKVHQVLQKTSCLIEGQYIVLKLKRLLTLNLLTTTIVAPPSNASKWQMRFNSAFKGLQVNQFMDLSKLMQSTVTPQLLLTACEGNQQVDEETKDVIRPLFDTTKQTKYQNHIYLSIRRQHD
jgi:hypothetical protein